MLAQVQPIHPIGSRKKTRGVFHILKDLKYLRMPETAAQCLHVVMESVHEGNSRTAITLDRIEHNPSFSESVILDEELLKRQKNEQGQWEERVHVERLSKKDKNVESEYDVSESIRVSIKDSIDNLTSAVNEVKQWVKQEIGIGEFLQNECSKKQAESDKNVNDEFVEECENYDEEKATNLSQQIASWINDISKKGFPQKIRNSYKKDFNYDSEEEHWFEEGVVRVFDPYYYELEQEEVKSTEGRLNRNGELIGRGSYTLNNGDELNGLWKQGVRHGFGSSTGLNLQAHGVDKVSGIYKDGVLHGDGSARLLDGTILEGSYNNSHLEGPVVGRAGENGGNTFIGQYVAGLPSKYVWKRLEGGGWLHGYVDEKGQLTGDNIMYVYPDLYTLLAGTFKNGVMISARESHVDYLKMIDDVLSVIPEKGTGPIFSYSPPTNKRIEVTWMQMDPFERDRVECRVSEINNAGIGLFAKRKLPAGTYAAFYHGVHFKQNEYSPDKTYNYQIFLDWKKAPWSDFMDLLPETWSHTTYCASLGHKVNHKFYPNCEYTKFEHPRFGKVLLGIKTMMDIEKGEELSANYRYDANDAPAWYTAIYSDDNITYSKNL